MLLDFSGDRTWRFRSGGEHNDESRLPSLSPFMGLVFAAITTEVLRRPEFITNNPYLVWLVFINSGIERHIT